MFRRILFFSITISFASLCVRARELPLPSSLTPDRLERHLFASIHQTGVEDRLRVLEERIRRLGLSYFEFVINAEVLGIVLARRAVEDGHIERHQSLHRVTSEAYRGTTAPLVEEGRVQVVEVLSVLASLNRADGIRRNRLSQAFARMLNLNDIEGTNTVRKWTIFSFVVTTMGAIASVSFLPFDHWKELLPTSLSIVSSVAMSYLAAIGIRRLAREQSEFINSVMFGAQEELERLGMWDESLAGLGWLEVFNRFATTAECASAFRVRARVQDSESTSTGGEVNEVPTSTGRSSLKKMEE